MGLEFKKHFDETEIKFLLPNEKILISKKTVEFTKSLNQLTLC